MVLSSIHKKYLIAALVLASLFFQSCECPTSDSIAYDAEALEGASFSIVDATGNAETIIMDIADVEQLTIAPAAEMPVLGKIESGRQVLSIRSASHYFFSGPIDTDPSKEYIAVLFGPPLFADFKVMSTDTLPSLAVFNATDTDITIGEESPISSANIVSLTAFPQSINGSPLQVSISKGMIVIMATEPNLQYAEIAY